MKKGCRFVLAVLLSLPQHVQPRADWRRGKKRRTEKRGAREGERKREKNAQIFKI